MIHVDDIHIREQLHHELHSYSFEKNSWTLQSNLNEPGPICDHSASMIEGINGKEMIVFGGSMMNFDLSLHETRNDLWKWTGTQRNIWTKIPVEGIQPEGRKGSILSRNSSKIFFFFNL